MSAKLRPALGSAALAGLLLLPLAAGLFRPPPAPPPPPLVLAPPPSEVEVLIRRGRHEEAYALLREAEAAGDTARGAVHQYRLAVCERALGMADSALAPPPGPGGPAPRDRGLPPPLADPHPSAAGPA